MNSKQKQIKHWIKTKYPCPHTSKLEWLWNRAGIIEDIVALRTFRLELEAQACLN